VLLVYKFTVYSLSRPPYILTIIFMS